MIYFYALIVFCLLARMAIARKNRIFLIFYATAYLLLISGLRSENFGTDVAGYLTKYAEISGYSLVEIWDEIFSLGSKDPFFYFVSKLISLSGAPAQLYLALLSALYLISFAIATKKLSPDPALSYIFLISFGFLAFSYSGLRQAVAMSFLMLAITPLLEKRYFVFVGYTLIGCLFHASAFLFLICPVLMRINFKKYGMILMVGLGIFVFMYADLAREFIFSLNFERLSTYEDDYKTLNASGFAIYLAMYVFCFYSLKKAGQVDDILLSLALIGVVMQALALVVAEFFRIGLYFNICFAFLIPRVLYTMGGRQMRQIANISIYSVFVAYFIYSQLFSDFELVDF